MEADYLLPFVKQPTCCVYPENDKAVLSFLPRFFQSVPIPLVLRLKSSMFSVFCVLSRMPHVPPDQFYRINNICRGVQIMSCTILNSLQTSVIASLLGT